MTLFNYNSFLLFLMGASAALCSNECLTPNKSALPEDLPVDCHDMPSSLDTILVYLLGEGTSFGGNVFTATDGKFYEDASHQYASSRVKTSPSFIVEAMNQADVQAAVMFASECGHKVTARSGGHSYVGSSSCDGGITSCIQLDVGNLNHVDVALPQVHVGPGARLEDLYPVLAANNVFLPSGECADVAVGGHVQTGGYGNWMRQFGLFNSYVSTFDIVLSDGSLVTVTRPEDDVTSRFNDDLWHAFLGGASGSFGVVVDITFTPVKDDEHIAFYWEVNFLYADNTKVCIRNMLEEYAMMLQEEDFKNDSRWNIYFSVAAFKTLLSARIGPLAFNYVQLDLTWVVPSSFDKSQEFTAANAVYERLFAAYKSGGATCLTLDEHFDQLGLIGPTLKSTFPSHYATASDSKTLSELHNDVALFDWDALGLEELGVPFKSSFQQGPRFPTAEELLEVFDNIDALVPVDPLADKRLIVSQIVTLPGPSHADDKKAQPFQNDVFGVVVDIWSWDGIDYGHDLRAIQDIVIQSFDGEDHRMFWAAYEDTCLECGAWEKYFETRPAYNKLTQTKRCVDPDNLFKFRMSMPTNPLNENLF